MNHLEDRVLVAAREAFQAAVRRHGGGTAADAVAASAVTEGLLSAIAAAAVAAVRTDMTATCRHERWVLGSSGTMYCARCGAESTAR